VPDNGKSVTLVSTRGDDTDYEWTTIEIVLIRIDTGWVANGTFPVYSEVKKWHTVGFDAAVCVQKYEPWVIEAYNTSAASPSILRIVEKGNGNTSSPSGNIRGPPIENTRYLNTSGVGSAKAATFDVAYSNGVQQMRRTNYEDLPYIFSSAVGPIVPLRQIFF